MVVGGGITGLTAAYRLSQAGVEVTVVEPDRLGGKLQTSVVAGRAVDEAADAFLLRVPWALALCHDLDIDGELVSPEARTADVFVGGARHPLPEGQVLGVPTDLDALARSGILSADGLARVAEDLALPADGADPAVSGADVAIGPYLRRRLGDEVVDHLIDPLIGGINAGDTGSLSLAAVVPQLDAAARSGDPSLIRSCRAQRARAAVAPTAPIFATPIGGMARLVDALVALLPGVDWRVGRRAEAIEVRAAGPAGPGPGRSGGNGEPSPGRSGGARVVLDDGTVLDTDAVLLACPAHAAAGLVGPLAAEAGATLAAIGHSSVTMATFSFEADALLGDVSPSGCLVPRDQGLLLTAISFATSKWAQLR
ncbi:MAG: hemG, partial [Acidimicrobiales bacterium]|nr:hemG [Acidimicrobiales bacterium]